MEIKTMKEKALEKVFKGYSRAAGYAAKRNWAEADDQSLKVDYFVEAYVAIGLMTYEEGSEAKIKAYHERGIEVKECSE